MASNLFMDSQNSKEPYAVVQFDGADEEGRLCIDLVLKKWFTTSGRKKMCKYPPETQYHLRDQYLEKFKTPEKSWSCVPYTFIVGAGKFSNYAFLFLCPKNRLKNPAYFSVARKFRTRS